MADAHLILVFDGGSVVEAGSHAELLARQGRYAEMWRRQQEATPLGGASQQAEAPLPLALGDGDGSAAGLRGLGPGLSRTTSCTATERGDDDDDDDGGDDDDEEEEHQQRQQAAARPRAAADLGSIAEEAEEEARQRASPAARPDAGEPSPPRGAEARPAEQQTPARGPQPAEQQTPARAPPSAEEDASPARQTSPHYRPASRHKPAP